MTKKIQWDDSYLLGIPKIDEQHKELVSIINELYDATQHEMEVYCRKLPSILKKLTDYTIYHFGEEERLMAKYESITLDLHKMQHKTFISELTKQMGLLVRSKPEEGLQFYSYLLTWLMSHIAKSDRTWALSVLPKMNAETNA